MHESSTTMIILTFQKNPSLMNASLACSGGGLQCWGVAGNVMSSSMFSRHNIWFGGGGRMQIFIKTIMIVFLLIKTITFNPKLKTCVDI